VRAQEFLPDIVVGEREGRHVWLSEQALVSAFNRLSAAAGHDFGTLG
jgi:hypothetical protein